MPEKMKINRWRLPLVVGSALVLAVAIAVGIGVLIAHDQKPPTVPAAFASSTPSRQTEQPTDLHGQKACELNKQAYDTDRLLDDATVIRINAEGQQSASQEIRFAAQMLLDRESIAKGGEPAAVINLGTASIQLQTACVKAGLGN